MQKTIKSFLAGLGAATLIIACVFGSGVVVGAQQVRTVYVPVHPSPEAVAASWFDKSRDVTTPRAIKVAVCGPKAVHGVEQKVPKSAARKVRAREVQTADAR